MGADESDGLALNVGVAVSADESDGLALGNTVGVDVAHADSTQLTVGVALVGGEREELELTEGEAAAEEHWDGMLGCEDGDAEPVAKPSHWIARTRLL